MESSEHAMEEISPEHFISEHTFLYVIKGIMRCYDGSKMSVYLSGNGGLARKNRLGRYKKEKEDGELEKVFVVFDEGFLRLFQQRHPTNADRFSQADTFLKINTMELLPSFIQSLLPYYKGGGQIDPTFSDIKREELLLILLQHQPELAGVLFDFLPPGKINLEGFMNDNYKFNVSVGRLAYLTGRSVSAFKRDFKSIFHETPSRWLVRRRLQEAYFLIDKKEIRPSEIYFDLGFETLSHFSYAFKKKFGVTPSEVLRRRGGGS